MSAWKYPHYHTISLKYVYTTIRHTATNQPYQTPRRLQFASILLPNFRKKKISQARAPEEPQEHGIADQSLHQCIHFIVLVARRITDVSSLLLTTEQLWRDLRADFAFTLAWTCGATLRSTFPWGHRLSGNVRITDGGSMDVVVDDDHKRLSENAQSAVRTGTPHRYRCNTQYCNRGLARDRHRHQPGSASGEWEATQKVAGDVTALHGRRAPVSPPRAALSPGKHRGWYSGMSLRQLGGEQTSCMATKSCVDRLNPITGGGGANRPPVVFLICTKNRLC